MSPAFGEEKGSPCKGCEFQDEDKKKFIECINCDDRFGGNTRFLPERTKKPHRQVKKKKCAWPHGCDDKAAKSDYCTEHQRLIQDRRRRYKKQGMSEEEMAELLVLPIRKGPNRDPLVAIRTGGLEP